MPRTFHLDPSIGPNEKHMFAEAQKPQILIPSIPLTYLKVILSKLDLITTMVYTIVVHLYAKEDQESINKLAAKLQEASQVYSRDKETLSWYDLPYSLSTMIAFFLPM